MILIAKYQICVVILALQSTILFRIYGKSTNIEYKNVKVRKQSKMWQQN